PIFHTMIVLEPPTLVPDASWRLEHEVAIGKALGSSNFDLHISLDEKADGHIAGRLIYDTDLIEPDTAARMVGHWQALLEAIARQPGARISELPLMTDSERHQQLVEWNSAEVEYPRTCCL